MSVVPINILLQMFTENTSYFCLNERFSSSCKNEMFHESYRHIAVPAYRNNTSEGNSFLFGWCSFVFSIQRVSECSTTLFYNIQSNHLLPMINNIYIYATLQTYQQQNMHKRCRTSILEIFVPVKENSFFGGGRSDLSGYSTNTYIPYWPSRKMREKFFEKISKTIFLI